MKKILSLLLILLFVVSAFAACGSDETTSEELSQNASTNEDESSTEETPADPYEHLRELDFGGATVIFYVEGDELDRYKSIEIMPHELSPEIIKEAVSERNAFIEDLLNVVITEIRTTSSINGEMQTQIRASLSGDPIADIVMPYMPAAANLAIEGAFYSLNRATSGSSFDPTKYIKIDQPYWDQRANADLSIANNIFFTTGDFSLLTMDCTHAIVFNKTIVKNNTAIQDPYELLTTGKWTIDALHTNAKLATTEVDGEEGFSYNDIIGFYINSNFPTSMFIGAGERLTTKDSSDFPVLALGSGTAQEVVDKLVTLVADTSATMKIESIIPSSAGYPDVWSAATAAFANNRVLFRALAITDLNELAEYEVEYGILPVPKLTEEQENYNNIVSAIYASCAAIPLNAPNPDMSAAVLEAIAISSTDTIKVQYYENVLKNRRMPDEDGEKALDIIFESRCYEPGKIFTWGSLSSFVDGIVNSGINTYASSYEANKTSFELEIEKTVNAYNN